MSAPPLLRPLRAILQRRLHIVSSRPLRTPHHPVRASHYRLQPRYNSSSIPPADQPPGPESAAAATEGPPEQQGPDRAAASQDTAPDDRPADPSADNASAQAPVASDVHHHHHHGGGGGDAPLDGARVKAAAFQQLQGADAEIQAGIAEAVARRLEGAEGAAEGLGEREHAVQEQGDGAPAERKAEMPGAQEHAVQKGDKMLDTQEPVLAGAAELETPGLQDDVSVTAAPEEPFLQQAGPEEVVAEAVPESTPQDSVQQEKVPPEPVQQAASPAAASPAAAPALPAAPPGLEALTSATPDQLAAMMAYLQTLQAAKGPAAAAEAAKPEPAKPAAPEEQQQQQQVAEPVASQSSTPSSPIADAVAAMTQPVEPAELEPDTAQAASETPVPVPTPAENAPVESMNAEEDDFVVDPILSPEEQAIPAMAQEYENLSARGKKVVEQVEPEPEMAPVAESAESAGEEPVAEDTAVDVGEPPELDKAKPLPLSSEAAVEEELVASVPQDQGHYSMDDAVKAALGADQTERDQDEAQSKEEEGAPEEREEAELSRLPRNVATYYLQPLRRVAEYGVPACDLQLRSYSVRPLESFCDFALRAAYYLGLPAYGPVALPKMIERWTVPRSHFIYKKSQENFERITRRRLIQIKDGNPETVQLWLAFLQKHQQPAVGMKANLWEFSSIDVAKQLDEVYKKAKPMIEDNFRLWVHKGKFESVEKVDELLQAERYWLTGDRVERNQ